MNESENNQRRMLSQPLAAGLVGGVVGGVVTGIAAGFLLASYFAPSTANFPFPRGATNDYLCFCKIGRAGNSPGDFFPITIPPGPWNSCPHRNPCNNIGCDAHTCRQ